MEKRKIDVLDLEELEYQFERIDNLVRIIQQNYYDKSTVDYNSFDDCYELCMSYKDVSILLDTIQEIARNNQTKAKSLYEINKDIKSE